MLAKAATVQIAQQATTSDDQGNRNNLRFIDKTMSVYLDLLLARVRRQPLCSLLPVDITEAELLNHLDDLVNFADHLRSRVAVTAGVCNLSASLELSLCNARLTEESSCCFSGLKASHDRQQGSTGLLDNLPDLHAKSIVTP